MNKGGYWPYTPNTNLLYGLAEALRHAARGRPGHRLRPPPALGRRRARGRACLGPGDRSAPTRRSIRRCSPAWSLPAGIDADRVRRTIHERFDLSLGTGLGKIKGRMFRIGHLGDSNDLTLLATLAGCEMGLKLSGVALAGSGVQAAMDFFAAHPQRAAMAVS